MWCKSEKNSELSTEHAQWYIYRDCRWLLLFFFSLREIQTWPPCSKSWVCLSLLFLFVWHPSLHTFLLHPPPFSFSLLIPAAKLSVKQTEEAGMWPTFLLWRSTVWQYSTVCSCLCSVRTHPHPGSLAADWVVIVIKRSLISRESTMPSADGWSSLTGWPIGGSLSERPPALAKSDS